MTEEESVLLFTLAKWTLQPCGYHRDAVQRAFDKIKPRELPFGGDKDAEIISLRQAVKSQAERILELTRHIRDLEARIAASLTWPAADSGRP